MIPQGKPSLAGGRARPSQRGTGWTNCSGGVQKTSGVPAEHLHWILQALRAKAEDLAKPGWGATGHRPGAAGCEVPHAVPFSLYYSSVDATQAACLGFGRVVGTGVPRMRTGILRMVGFQWLGCTCTFPLGKCTLSSSERISGGMGENVLQHGKAQTKQFLLKKSAWKGTFITWILAKVASSKYSLLLRC